MKRAGMVHHLLWLASVMVFLAGCTSPSAQRIQLSPSPTIPSAQTSPSPGQPARLLQPNVAIPASCQATPAYLGGPLGSDSPWLQAQPASSGIVAYLAYSEVSPSGTYRLPHTNGFFPEDGLYTKTFWTIEHQEASSMLLIDGTDAADGTKTFHDTGNAISGPGVPTGPNLQAYTSYLQAPSMGCWRLQITSGQAQGTITMWFVG